MVAVLPRTSLGLVSETETLCKPSDCPGRLRVREVCERHGDYHDFELFRHCDASGNLIHMNVSTNLHVGGDYSDLYFLGSVC